ncbi:hypothetical protein DBR46_16290 [Pseudomonas sp. KBW05]|nr:hypothetical protein DBR46_16290 [Pseudomonas sp. KBW05]
MGAGLLAKAVIQPLDRSADTPPSRASPLPQMTWHLHVIFCIKDAVRYAALSQGCSPCSTRSKRSAAVYSVH